MSAKGASLNTTVDHASTAAGDAHTNGATLAGLVDGSHKAESENSRTSLQTLTAGPAVGQVRVANLRSSIGVYVHGSIAPRTVHGAGSRAPECDK